MDLFALLKCAIFFIVAKNQIYSIIRGNGSMFLVHLQEYNWE